MLVVSIAVLPGKSIDRENEWISKVREMPNDKDVSCSSDALDDKVRASHVRRT